MLRVKSLLPGNCVVILQYLSCSSGDASGCGSGRGADRNNNSIAKIYLILAMCQPLN